MEHRYCVLRAHLDELGYRHPLSMDSVPLVERLLADLVKTTESLQEYKDIAQSAIEERDHLQLGAEPYKCDNAKLVQECNDLHLAFLQFREQTEKLQRDLKHRINILEREKKELLEAEKKAREKVYKPGFKRTIVSKTTTGSRTVSSLGSTKSKTSIQKTDLKSKSSEELENMMTLAEQRIANLAKEVKKLKGDHSQQIELIDTLQTKLHSRDKEIKRLTTQLEGGRPVEALNKDCCYKDLNSKIMKLSEENNMHLKEKRDLEAQLSDSISKQHEAMKRALHLAERNKKLEKELKDIDQMAIAVETDCDNKVKSSTEKITKFQEKLDNKDIKIDNLERTITDIKRKKNSLEADLENLTHEKQKLQEIVENALEDKKRMTDRINQFTRIEHDLNLEIDRLVQVSTLQKRKIAELECQMVSGKFEKIGTGDLEMERYNCECENSKIARRSRQGSETRKKPHDGEFISELKRNLSERDQMIESLQQEIREMLREKQSILSKVEQLQEIDRLGTEAEGMSMKSSLARVEKERDLARADVRRLENERDALRDRLKLTAETNVTERAKLEKIILDTEEKLHSLETERRELITVQGSRRAAINNLEEQVETLSDKLRASISEVTHLQTLYSQIKTLQDQTDRALADTQAQLTQVEIEYSHAQERIRELECDRAQSDMDLGTLRNDIAVMKGSLAKLDSEKDALLIEVDNKTETVALLEQDLKSKDTKIASLETAVAELTQKLNLNRDNVHTSEFMVKNVTSELNMIRKDLELAKKEKNLAIAENRRIQEAVSLLTRDKCQLECDLEIRKREVEDLKKQLQEYVFEVKRAEDLLQKKENERTEMLDQFRSLSHEATVLENNNHSLETQAVETKSKLNEALDSISDLKHEIDVQNTLNKDYENQIKQLTTHIACLEAQLKQHTTLQNQAETELGTYKELCLKLDCQKEKLLRELTENENSRVKLQDTKVVLEQKLETLGDQLDRGKDTITKLEKLLSSTRQENIEQRLMNSDQLGEIQRLKGIVEELKLKNTSIQQQLDVFQEKALDYSQQIKLMRREIANERFHRAHSGGDTSNRYPSL